MIIEMRGKKYQVYYIEDTKEVERQIVLDQPEWIVYDTETNGLHLKKSLPFLGIIAWSIKNPEIAGVSYIFPASFDNLQHLPKWAAATKRIYAHNTSFDMHMTANVIGDEAVLSITNWGDTMGLCRLIFEAISSRDGGDNLKLKHIGKKYIDPEADKYEKAVKNWLSLREAENNKVLTVLLKSVGWTKKRFQASLDGKEPLAPEVVEVYNEWQKEYPSPTYKDVPMEIMGPYAASDGVLTDLLVHRALPVVYHKQQQDVMEMEFELIPVVFDMERLGIEIDRKYLKESADRLDEFIDNLTIRMVELAGREFTVGQHKLIKDLYEERLGDRPKSTDKQFMKAQAASGDELAEIISKLRTAEKWRATYITRILEVSEHDGRFYSQCGQFNPVSGRFSGDAQQFPKDPILTVEGDKIKKADGDYSGEIIYHPRKAFLGRTYYLDYSQVELRVQAHYTLPFGGDTNLCRAYMPFGCVHWDTGERYSYDTFDERRRWIELRAGSPADKHWEDQLKEGWSVWLVPETGLPWKPTDVHSATTLKALVIMGLDPETMSKKEIKWWRDKGKRFNFMRNYGGGDAKAAEVLEIKLSEAKAMNKGYTEAFPLVVVYQKKVERAMHNKGYAITKSGRRYYLTESRRFYKVGNYLIQGWAADMLKRKMIEIWKYIHEQKSTIRMQLCVHDELQFSVPEGEDHHIPIIRDMMEDLQEVNVPIVAEVEITETNWAEKRKVIGI